MEFKAKEIAEILNGTVEGNPEAKISAFARIDMPPSPSFLIMSQRRKGRTEGIADAGQDAFSPQGSARKSISGTSVMSVAALLSVTIPRYMRMYI